MYSYSGEAFFEAAHFQNGVCGANANLHGHSFRVLVRLEGETSDLPTALLREELDSLVGALDHRLLLERGSLRLSTMDAFENEGFELAELPFPPTAGNLARHFFHALTEKNLPIRAVTVFPGAMGGASYREAPP